MLGKKHESNDFRKYIELRMKGEKHSDSTKANINEVEDMIGWNTTEYISKIPKLEKCLQNTIFEWVDWGLAKSTKPVIMFETIVLEDEETEDIFDGETEKPLNYLCPPFIIVQKCFIIVGNTE